MGFADLQEVDESRFKGVHDHGVEMPAALTLDHFPRSGDRHGGLVGTLGCEGIVHIGQGQDACRQRDFHAAQTRRVSGAIESFVVVEGDDGRHPQKTRIGGLRDGLFQNVGTDDCVLLHALKLIGR